MAEETLRQAMDGDGQNAIAFRAQIAQAKEEIRQIPGGPKYAKVKTRLKEELNRLSDRFDAFAINAMSYAVPSSFTGPGLRKTTALGQTRGKGLVTKGLPVSL
jgi:hypothetical protein